MSLSDSLHTLTTLMRQSYEEAARFGRKDADIEHLLLALTLTDTPAGDVLRSHGATWESTVQALQHLDSEALESLGITAPTRTLSPNIAAVEGYTKRVNAVFKKAKKASPDLLSILITLVNEPSGTIARVLDRLGTSAAEITAAAQIRLDTVRSTRRGNHRATSSGVIPTTHTELLAFLRNPINAAIWEPMLLGRTIEAGASNDHFTAPSLSKLRKSHDARTFELYRIGDGDESVAWKITVCGSKKFWPLILQFTVSDDPSAGAATAQSTAASTDESSSVTLHVHVGSEQPSHISPMRRLLAPLAHFTRVLHAHNILVAISNHYRQ